MHLAVLAEAASRDDPAARCRTAGPRWPAGRAEVAALTAGLVGAAAAASGGLLLVTGEGGIGKTRLAAELGTVGAGHRRVRCSQTRCYASERSLFLQPLVDAFAARAGRAAGRAAA